MEPPRHAVSQTTRANVLAGVREASQVDYNLFEPHALFKHEVAWRSVGHHQRVFSKTLSDGSRADHKLAIIGVVTNITWVLEEAPSDRLVKFDIQLAMAPYIPRRTATQPQILFTEDELNARALSDVDPSIIHQQPHLHSIIHQGTTLDESEPWFYHSDPSPLEGRVLTARPSLCLGPKGVLEVIHRFSVDEEYPKLCVRDAEAVSVAPTKEDVTKACLGNAVKCTIVLEATHIDQPDDMRDIVTARLVDMTILGPVPSQVSPPGPLEQGGTKKRSATAVIDSVSKKPRTD